MEYKEYLPVFFVALVVAFLATPLSMKLAVRLGIMDVPRDNRRMHNESLPRFGGLAIYVATTVALFVFGREYPYVWAVILGGTLIFILGALDDKINIPPYVKFICQLAVASLMYVMGIRMKFLSNFIGGDIVRLGAAVDFLFTVIWIVGITNSINLIDGIDGLAAGTVIINTMCMAYVIMHDGASEARLLAAIGLVVVAGASIGFLPFNFSPAKTFMGDGGALFLGFMIAVLSTVGRLKGSAAVTMIIPISVIGLPIFDTLFAMARRLVKRNSIMQADKQHLHHILMASGYGHRRAAIMLYGISIIMGVIAILIYKGYWMEPTMLFGAVILYIYVFLTDTTAAKDKHKAEKKEESLNE